MLVYEHCHTILLHNCVSHKQPENRIIEEHCRSSNGEAIRSIPPQHLSSDCKTLIDGECQTAQHCTSKACCVALNQQPFLLLHKLTSFTAPPRDLRVFYCLAGCRVGQVAHLRVHFHTAASRAVRIAMLQHFCVWQL